MSAIRYSKAVHEDSQEIEEENDLDNQFFKVFNSFGFDFNSGEHVGMLNIKYLHIEIFKKIRQKIDKIYPHVLKVKLNNNIFYVLSTKKSHRCYPTESAYKIFFKKMEEIKFFLDNDHVRAFWNPEDTICSKDKEYLNFKFFGLCMTHEEIDQLKGLMHPDQIKIEKELIDLKK